MTKRLPILLVVIISIIACAFCACNKPEPDAPPPADEEKPIVLVDFPTRRPKKCCSAASTA